MLGRWADLMLVAPLSCNTLAKMANGFCDNMLLATYLSATCPVVVAPAMDEDMWHHPTTKRNLEKLESFGNTDHSGRKRRTGQWLYGDGRMAEPETISQFIAEHFFLKEDLAGKKVLVTAGPTYEPIDPVGLSEIILPVKWVLLFARNWRNAERKCTWCLGPSSSVDQTERCKGA